MFLTVCSPHGTKAEESMSDTEEGITEDREPSNDTFGDMKQDNLDESPDSDESSSEEEIVNIAKKSESLAKDDTADSDISSSEEESVNVVRKSDSSSESDPEDIVQVAKTTNKKRNNVNTRNEGMIKSYTMGIRKCSTSTSNVTKSDLDSDSDKDNVSGEGESNEHVTRSDDLESSENNEDRDSGNGHVMKRIKHVIKRKKPIPTQGSQVQKGATKRKMPNSGDSSFTKIKKKAGTSPKTSKKNQETIQNSKGDYSTGIDGKWKETKRTKVKNGAKVRKTSRNR